MVIRFIAVFIISISTSKAWSQQAASMATQFLSEIDQTVTLNYMTIGSAYDNVGGIYKNAAEKKLIDLITQDHIWSFVDSSAEINNFRNDDLYEDPTAAAEFLEKTKTDGFFLVNIIKGQKGMSVAVTLFSKLEGLPVAQESIQDAQSFQMADFEKVIEDLYRKLKLSLPYYGATQSRRGNSITVNIGTRDGVKIGDQVSIIQILKVKRHPKHNFIVGVEKEVLGQGVVTKSEDTLSFVSLNFEKEPNVIQKGAKLQRVSTTVYGSPNDDSTKILSSQEWLPPAIPQFGYIYAGLGISNYKQSSILVNGSSLESGSNVVPTFNLGAELWVTPRFTAAMNFRQMFFTGNNAVTGSDPDKLNFNVSQIDFGLGYRQALTDNFWGAHVKAAAGYLTANHQVSDSQPTAFTSLRASGLYLGLSGYFPVTKDNDLAIGVDTKFLLSPELSESPVSSGSTDPSISDLNFFGVYQWTTNIQFKGFIQTNTIQSNFSGTATRTNPARSVEAKTSTYGVNLEYMF